MKTLEILKDKFFNKDKATSERLEKNRVRVAIEGACNEYLTDFNSVLTFEALPNALDGTLAVIEEPNLTAKYDFYQVSETIFQVRLREINLL